LNEIIKNNPEIYYRRVRACQNIISEGEIEENIKVKNA